MLFNSLQFFIFIFVLIPIFFQSSSKNQKRLLFYFSLYFYSCLKIVFVPLLFFSFLITHYTSLGIYYFPDKIYKKILLYINLFINLGLLVLFKYADFLRNIEYDFLNLIGISNELHPESLGFILPLGISFYTFQAIAYTVDVYRQKLIPEKSFFDFSLFLLFFPQLVAGPIMRASELIHQFNERKHWNSDRVIIGLGIITLGYFKKTIIADPIANLIQPIYSNPSQYNWLSNLTALFLFTIQIYCDFSGYSDIAIGTGKILGFEIPKNFERPFLATSVTMTWRRWHISLSSWLRDYIYISLGGNRVSHLRNMFNLFLTTVIGGFWHGANWTFIIWGSINGFLNVVEKYFMDKNWDRFFDPIPKPIKIIYSFLVFMMGAHFFRSDSVHSTFVSYKKIFSFADGMDGDMFKLKIFVPVLILIGYEILEEIKFLSYIKNSKVFNYLKLPLYAGVLILCFMIYTVVSSPQFYYFQF
jgi:alginate O-acetyltransferase complex protein AlgI